MMRMVAPLQQLIFVIKLAISMWPEDDDVDDDDVDDDDVDVDVYEDDDLDDNIRMVTWIPIWMMTWMMMMLARMKI